MCTGSAQDAKRSKNAGNAMRDVVKKETGKRPKGDKDGFWKWFVALPLAVRLLLLCDNKPQKPQARGGRSAKEKGYFKRAGIDIDFSGVELLSVAMCDNSSGGGGGGRVTIQKTGDRRKLPPNHGLKKPYPIKKNGRKPGWFDCAILRWRWGNALVYGGVRGWWQHLWDPTGHAEDCRWIRFLGR
jgi:hypothetical protein